MVDEKSRSSKIVFTKKKLLDLPPPGSGRVYFYDAGCDNLALCITASGNKTFYRTGRIGGRMVRMKIGRFPTFSVDNARAACQVINGDVARGDDPHETGLAKRRAATLKNLFDLWIDRAKLRKKTWEADKWMFEKYFDPLASRKISHIRPSDVAAWHQKLGTDSGKTTANRCKWLLSTLYNYAPKIGYEGANPVKGVENFPEVSRDRFLLPGEMQSFFSAVVAEDQPWRDFFLTMLLTGQRKSNVCSMRWDEIDLKSAVWTVPAAKAKAGKPIPVALSPPVYAILCRRRAEIGDENPWVFPGDSAEGRIVDPKKAWARVLTISGIDNLRMHDLRRSLGSWQAALGASLAIIGKSLGHADLSSTQVYARLQLDPVRESVTKASQAMLDAGKATIDAGSMVIEAVEEKGG
jgi:integrase